MSKAELIAQFTDVIIEIVYYAVVIAACTKYLLS